MRKLEMHPLGAASHTVTFRRITLVPFRVRVARLPAADGVTKKQIELKAVTKLAVSSATRKIAALATKAVSHFHK
jgi:hypothetical protein